MSTFKGIVAEFPQIRIDYFRHQPGHKAPLACFLSHVHNDHLAGLESLRAPFVYCSPATREILLRLEKYHHRINFAQRKLESRTVTYDRSMRKLAKPLPLDTPTVIELAPGSVIHVTLIDANHCIGAVMFLIQGHGKAILYTGDVRAEQWWVNSLVQNPVLLPYTLGTRRLDCMYLDTTFATKSQPYREFQSKAEGIRQLLEQVAHYPEDTIFYFHSWTFGYENVWIALSTFLQSRIHLDQYRARLYGSLSSLDSKSLREAGLDVRSDNTYLRNSGLDVREAPALCGFKNGNRVQPGCLTSETNTRIHSCERLAGCPVMDHDKAGAVTRVRYQHCSLWLQEEKNEAQIVHIIPIITHVKDTNLYVEELGIGGGKGDLDQKEELETGTAFDIEKIMEHCRRDIQDQQLLSKISNLLQDAVREGKGTINLASDLASTHESQEADVSLEHISSTLSSHVKEPRVNNSRLNRTIRFPYSRHSSFYELCHLVDAFKPIDLVPCTVDEKTWDPERSMRHLFGHFCSGDTFCHDNEMMKMYEARLEKESYERHMQDRSQGETQSNGAAQGTELDCLDLGIPGEGSSAGPAERVVIFEDSEDPCMVTAEAIVTCRETNTEVRVPEASAAAPEPSPNLESKRSAEETPHAARLQRHKRLKNLRIAYQAALGINGLTWADLGGLVSARSHHEEEEL